MNLVSWVYPRQMRIYRTGVVFLTIVGLLVSFWNGNDPIRLWISGSIAILLTVLGAVFFFQIALRLRAEGLPWLLLGAALPLQVLGGVIGALSGLGVSRGVGLSAADICWCLYFGLFLGGLELFPHPKLARIDHYMRILDGFLILIGTGILSWFLANLSYPAASISPALVHGLPLPAAFVGCGMAHPPPAC